MDVMRADTVDADLDRLISWRASTDHRTSADELEPSYLESVRRFNARVRAENRAAWCDFHRSQAERHKRTLEGLVAHHEAEAEKYMDHDKKEDAA